MKIEELKRAQKLADDRAAMVRLLDNLNRANGEGLPIDPKVLDYVDRKLAAKGLMSLLVETMRATDTELKNLGIG